MCQTRREVVKRDSEHPIIKLCVHDAPISNDLFGNDLTKGIGDTVKADALRAKSRERMQRSQGSSSGTSAYRFPLQ